MLSPWRPLVAVSLIAVAAASTATPVAAASGKKKAAPSYAVPCKSADGKAWEYLTKPKSCVVYDQASDAAATSLMAVKQLKWKSWGAKSATAPGHLKTDFFDDDITLKVSGLKKCTAKLSVYTKVQVMVPSSQNAIAASYKATCPTKD